VITTVRLDDYQYLVEQGHLHLLGNRTVDNTAREDRRERLYYQNTDYRHMMVVVQGSGGLLGLLDRTVVCAVHSFDADNPSWTYGTFPDAPACWRDGYLKVSIFRASDPRDQAKAEGTLITTLEKIWCKALGPTAMLLRHYDLLPMLQEEPNLRSRARGWLDVLRQTLKF
jgi:hypothetical protein